MKTSQNLLNTKYLDAVDSVIAYAQAQNFDPQTGDFSKLMTGWIESSRKLHVNIANNKEAVIKIIKNII